MTRSSGLIARARLERERTIDLRHEELPHGDWPHLDCAPLEDLDHDADHDVLLGLSIAAGLVLVVAIALLIWLASMVITRPAHAGDPTGYWRQQIAEGKAPPAAWWQGLASGKGSCCSNADGVRIEDVDWDTGAPNGRYRVHLCPHMAAKGVDCAKEWILVPENAVVADPNKYGPAVVWPYWDVESVTQIRCFLPGAGA